MTHSKIGYQRWVIAIFLMQTSVKGISSMKLHRDLGIKQQSAWFMIQRIREAMGTMCMDDDMASPVEVDEMYVGGKKNKHTNKKVAIAGAWDRKCSCHSCARDDICTLVTKHTKPDVMVYADESRIYAGLKNHETVNHSEGEYIRDTVHTNGIESFWVLLRCGYHHKMSSKHMRRFVNEFAGRLNECCRDTIDMMAELTRHMVRKRLTYAQLVADVWYMTGEQNTTTIPCMV